MTTTLHAPVNPPSSASIQPKAVRKFRPDIEGLRAVAVMLVVLAHSGLALTGGYVGVDVFFVISGFLITRQLAAELTARNRISFANFYARRVRRIVPAATVVIVATLVATWKWDSPLRVRSVSIDGLFSAFSGINWRLAATGTDYFQATSPPSPFQHYWSLGVEEQFYAVWPALLVILGVFVGRRFGRQKSLLWALVLVIAVSFYLSATTSTSSSSWAYFGLHTRAWELALGAFVALTVSVWTRMPPAFASQMSWLGLGFIVFAALHYGNSTVYPGTAVALPVVGAGFVIMGGCPGWPRSGELVLRRWPMQFLGKVSYSWYLWHWPVLQILPFALGHDLTTLNEWEAVGGSLGLAVLTFYLVEHPIRTQRFLIRRPYRGLALGAVLVTASIVTAVVVSNSIVIPGSGGPVLPLAQKVIATPSAIEQAVNAGAALTALPSNVQPALANAPHDHPNTRGCFSGYNSVAPLPDSACDFGDPNGTRTIAVVGDSHANAWSPAIEAFALKYHWRYILYAKPACPPGIYPDYVNPQSHRLYTECDQWRTAVFDRIDRLKPTVVLVTSQIRTLSIDPTGMVQSIHNFQASGARVLYLEDTPFAGNIGSVPDCLASHLKEIQKCSFNRHDPNTRLDNMLQRNLESAAAKKAGATLLDPTSWFCTATVCPPVINNMIVYSDNSHTTQTYVTWLSPVLGAELQKIVG
jgi:peptidoglycan/LPS O-acetylase OafA/YrhL